MNDGNEVALLQLLGWCLATGLVAGFAWRSRGLGRVTAQVVVTWGLAEVLLAALLVVGWRPGGNDVAPFPDTWDGGWTGPTGRRTTLSVFAAPSGPEHILPSEDAVRVAFIGDSFTAGEGVELAERFSSRIFDALEARGHAVDPMVYGVPGMGFVDAAALYLEAIAPRQPDVVVWVLIPNDFIGVEPSHVELAGDFIQVPLRERMAPSALFSLLTRPARVAAQSQVVATTYARAMMHRSTMTRIDALIGLMAQETSRRGAALLVVMFPFMHNLDDYPLAAMQRGVLQRAEAAGAEVFDLLPAFEGRDASALWVASSDHHPNAEGHRIAAEALLEPVASLLRKAGPRHCPTPSTPYDALIGSAPLRDALCEAPLDAGAWLALAHHWSQPRDEELGLWGGDRVVSYAAAAAEVLFFAEGDEAMAREAARLLPALGPPG